MRARSQLFATATAALLAAPAWLNAQAASQDDDGGRFDAIVMMMSNASPEEAESTARDIFEQAYESGQKTGNWQFAIRGYSAAARLPNLSQSTKNKLAFWHGYALFQQAVDEQKLQTIESAQETLPKFREARDLIASSGGYPTTVDVDVGALLDNIDLYAQMQQALMQRGR